MSKKIGIDITFSGHTHGGQVSLPFFKNINLSGYLGNYTSGHYSEKDSHLFVSMGLGLTTIFPCARIGTSPEIAVITLRKTEHQTTRNKF